MNPSLSRTFWCVVCFIVFVSSPVFASNIVLNGNFATGDFTDWTVNSESSFPWTVQTTGGLGGNPYDSDTYYASTGCVGAQCISGTAIEQASLSQVVTDASGTFYTLTFEFNTDGNGASNELQVLWDGTVVLDLGPDGTLGPIDNYTLYTVTGLEGTGSDTLTFLGRQDPGFDALDNVSVSSSVTAVPEPSTLMFTVGGLVSLAVLRRRRRV